MARKKAGAASAPKKQSTSKAKTGPKKGSRKKASEAKTGESEQASAPEPKRNHPIDPKEQALFLNHLPKIRTLREKLATANSNLRNAYKEAKGDGFSKADFDVAIQMQDAEKEAKAKARMTRDLVIARYVGAKLGEQLDLFIQDARVPAVDRAYEEGVRASMEGKSANPPYAPETEQYRKFMTGFHDDQEKRIKGGIKQLNHDADKEKMESKPPAAEQQKAPAPQATSGVPMTRSAFLAQQAAAQQQAAQSTEDEPSAFQKRSVN